MDQRIRRIGWGVTIIALVAVIVILFAYRAGGTATETCPETGKVTSQVDGDLDGIVLEAGTVVCIKAGNEMVTVTADGESTLAELIDNGHNVSHYTVLTETTTTTLVEETTTTQADEEPTTTQADEGTTTTVNGSTTTSQADTTTTAGDTTTTAGSTTTTDPGTPPDELPFTGIPISVWVMAGSMLVATGMFLVRRFGLL